MVSDNIDAVNACELNHYEMWWRDHAAVLKTNGYFLSPRLLPGWTPSWYGTSRLPTTCEDYFELEHRSIANATHIETGRRVVIKQVRSGSKEVGISRMMSTPERRRDPMNHCVPVLDSFRDSDDDQLEFIVMPLLRPFDDPRFTTVGEVVDFIKQTLEGLVYMHKEGVAHRNCAKRNIMMDASPSIPDGFHLSSPNRTHDNKADAVVKRRRDVPPMNYYFTDFSVSSHFTDPQAPALVTGNGGIDRHVPELYCIEPYDPFPVDVIILGHVYHDTVQPYNNTEFLRSLTDWMTQIEPRARPTASEALTRFNELAADCSGMSLRWRLKARDEERLQAIVLDLHSIAEEVLYQLGRVSGHLKRQLSSVLKWQRQQWTVRQLSDQKAKTFSANV